MSAKRHGAAAAGSGAKRGLPPGPRGIARAIPAVDWLRDYQPAWLRRDLVAGVLAAAAAIPEALGFADLAGLPERVGLFALVLPVVVYAVVGHSRDLAIAPTGPVAALVAATVVPLAGVDVERRVQLAAALAAMVAALLFLARLLRLGVFESFISRPVLRGYLTGSALVIALTELGPVLGARSEGRTAIEALSQLGASAGAITPVSLSFGLASVAALVLVRRLPWPIPASAVVLAAATAAGALCGLESRGLEALGEIGRGLPLLELPRARPYEYVAMLPDAVAIMVLIFTDSETLAGSYAQARGERIPSGRELGALGWTNLAASASGTFPVGGSVADSVFAEEAGARSPLSGVFGAGVVVAALLSGALFRRVPLVAIHAVVLVAVVEAVRWRGFLELARYDPRELAFGIFALLGVLLVGFVPGLLVAVVANLLSLLVTSTRVRVTQLGCVSARAQGAGETAEAKTFADIDRHPDAEPVPGVLIARVESALMFYNASAIMDRVAGLSRSPSPPTRAVVLDVGPVSQIDYTGCEELAQLARELSRQGMPFALANAIGSVRQALERFGLGGLPGVRGGRLDIAEAIAAVSATAPTPAPAGG